MYDDGFCFVTGCVCGFMLCVFISLGIIGTLNANWKTEAVEHGYAEYDGTTGEWQWKKTLEKLSEGGQLADD